jgi:tRNA 2-selenouridine synthase
MEKPKSAQAVGLATVAQLAEFDEVIDVRSPAEYALDHIPGALSCPVLDDEERGQVGTLHARSPFAARKVGAALILRRIADLLEQRFADRPREWRPLVYCWRGGKRSGGLTQVLRQIGWDACALEGGYKAYRRHVVTQLQRLPARFRFRVVCGATGNGKSRVLQALAALGAQVLDLERLAAHKGSVLGDLPDAPQPSQRMFETALLAALERMNPARPVFVEAESRKIGSLQIPHDLLAGMRASPCLRIDASLQARVRFLLDDYDYFVADPQRLKQRIESLRGLRSGETLERWKSLIDAGEWPELVRELLAEHYDPLYVRSQDRNYLLYPQAARFETDDLSPPGVERLAARILAAGSG